MNIFAVILVGFTFVGVWFFTSRNLAATGPIMRHLLAVPVAFVAAFCLMAILFFTGLAHPRT